MTFHFTASCFIRRKVQRRPRKTALCHFSAGLATLYCSLGSLSPVSCLSFLARSEARRATSLRVTQREPSTLIEECSFEEARQHLQPYFSFPLDDWQVQAGCEIWNGNNVIVCAPTGAGKTVVGEMALRISYEAGSNAIYTTPLKALSNQKFAELRPVFGKESVGLSTGDMSINRGARITVMTTEVYRNMAWRSSSSDGEQEPHSFQESKLLNRNELLANAVVVLDEFHYMGQPGRGGVWEESVITSPSHTQIVGLSATLPNAGRLAEWMEGVTGRKTMLIEFPGQRPVPLRYLFASKDGLHPLFRDPDAGPGAPKGLLGWRGDGEAEKGTKEKTKQKRGFGGTTATKESTGKTPFPKGLQINNALKMAIDKRIRKVNRNIERQKVKASLRDDDEELGWKRSRQKGMSAREEKRERERLLKIEMRRSVPSLSIVLKRLERRDLLPAIFFIFSRAGCDRAAESVCDFMRGQEKSSKGRGADEDSTNGSLGETSVTQESADSKRKRKRRSRRDRYNKRNTIEDSSGRSFRPDGNYVSEDLISSVLDWSATEAFAGEMGVNSRLSSENWEAYADLGLLTIDEVKEVASRVAAFNNDNEEIAFDDLNIEQFLFGVGSHHAGMLAAHKAFVEALYRAQLMKVVFSTETLAAGINMPARTTVICSLAKRGNGSTMNLLETANLMQMAGRAGRRGMDSDGTCVILATPFEGPDEATSILTNEVQPVVSQFSPSYSLAVNLIARGEGRLEIAKQLVQKSFAMWEKRQGDDDSLNASVQEDTVDDILDRGSHENFIESLINVFERRSDQPRVQEWLSLLGDVKTLKKVSKDYVGSSRILDIERSTLGYLERELETMKNVASDADKELLGSLFDEDSLGLSSEIESQRKRVLRAEKSMQNHPFTDIAATANEIMDGSSSEGQQLSIALETARPVEMLPCGALSAEELSVFAKSAVIMKRRTRKSKISKPDLESTASVTALGSDTWQDMLAITKVLVAYGCLSAEDPVDVEDMMIPGFLESTSFEVTQAGINVGMLGFDNSLWCLVALGGAWDVLGASSDLDELNAAFNTFDDDDNDNSASASDVVVDFSRKPQQEAETLVSHLQGLSPSELAGYVSCLVADGSRGNNGGIESFQRWPSSQQRAVQYLLSSMERIEEVQKKLGVDEASRRCGLELTACEVVTAWAAGCSWSEALELSGAAPGDLARTLSRVLDALRQFGNLPYTPVRASLSEDGESTTKSVSEGIHPEIRRLCREAAFGIDRYPVKDPLPFEAEPDEVADEFEEDAESQIGSDPEQVDEAKQDEGNDETGMVDLK